MTLHELGKFLEEPLVRVALCAIIGGLIMLVISVSFHNEYEKGGYESNHRRPANRDAKPWQLDTDGHPIVRKPKHQLNGTPGEETRLLTPTTNAARSRVVMIGPKGIIDGDHAGTSGRVRQSQKEDVEEEGREDRERREDEGRPLRNGEEGSAHEEAPSPVTNSQARWFRNTVTGEYVFVDEFGRRIDWSSGE